MGSYDTGVFGRLHVLAMKLAAEPKKRRKCGISAERVEQTFP
jgi:hypothetical protein